VALPRGGIHPMNPISSLEAVYTFHLDRYLKPHERDELDTIPGVSIHDKYGPPRVLVPYSIAWLVEGLLTQFHLKNLVTSPDVKHPRPWEGMETSGAVLRARILACDGLRDWLITGEGGFGWTVKDFQYEAVWFGLERDGMLLKEAGGAGKTLQSCIFAALDPSEGPVLIVTKSPVVTQFGRSILAFTGVEALELRAPSSGPKRKAKKAVWDGSADDGQGDWVHLDESIPVRERIQSYIDECLNLSRRPYVIVGWGSLRLHVNTLLGFRWRTVIFDECQAAKATKRRKYKGKDARGKPLFENLDNASCAAWRLACVVPRRLAMSATPIHDRREDLWGATTLVELNAWGGSAWKFLMRYQDATPGRHGGLDKGKASNTGELKKRLAFFLHDVPEAVSHAQLPPVRVFARFIGGREQDRTQGFRGEMKKYARVLGHGGEGVNEARGLLTELQLQEAAARCRTAAIDVAQEYIDRCVVEGQGKGKGLIFTGRHVDCWGLYEAATKRKSWERLGVKVWGGVARRDLGEGQNPRWAYDLLSHKERQAVQDAYMKRQKPSVLIATGYAWGTGLDLHDSDFLILNMLPWSPGDLDQWMKRVKRLGMNRPCDVVLMVPVGTAAERVVIRLLPKVEDTRTLVHQESMEGVRDTLLGLDRADEILKGIVEKVEAAAKGEWGIWGLD